MKHTNLNMTEWDKTVAKARERFITEVLGERPTRKEVAKNLHNTNKIDWLEWLGLLVMVAIGIVTGFKMTASALPFAASFFPAATNPVVIAFFQFFMALTFILMGTTLLVYAKLMDEFSPEIMNQKLKNPNLKFFGGWQGSIGAAIIVAAIFSWVIGAKIEIVAGSAAVTFLVCLWFGGIPTNLLPFASPRMYQWLVYIVAVWLFKISSKGVGDIFEQYVIVLAEIALTFLVAKIVQKQELWSQVVHSAWVEKTTPYDKRLAEYQSDKDFLEILFRELREALMGLERVHPDKTYKKHRPNYRMMAEASSEEIDAIIMAEFVRHTGGKRFASALLNGTEQEPEPQVELTEPKKRIPPQGDRYWTVDNLVQDFQVRGLKPDAEYSEKDLNDDYQDGYAARGAFREGARLYFSAYQK